MYAVEVYASVRQFVFVQGRSQREAARVFGLSRETIGKICRFSLPPGYTHEAGGEAEARAFVTRGRCDFGRRPDGAG